MATPSPEQRELSLVGKVEMRIALADTDTKLEATLKTYLAPLLLKLSSEHVSVRNKVISVCQHVNTRVKPRTVQLPVLALVKQFKENPQISLIRHFDLLYMQQGVGRLSAADKMELLPVVIQGIGSSGSQGSQIFNLLLQLLEYLTLPLRGSKEDSELRHKLLINDQDAAFLAEWFGKLLLFTPTLVDVTCAGLTEADYAFLTLERKDEIWTSTNGLNVMRTKILAARMLSSGLFTDSERFLPGLYASADPSSTISDVGDDMMKRTLPNTDLEDRSLVQRMFGLYFGWEGCPRVKAPLRLKVLGLLSKSTVSTTFSDRIVHLVDDGIAKPAMDGEDVMMTNGATSASHTGREATKLRGAVFSYINFVARYGTPGSLHAIAAKVVGRLQDYIENQGWPRPGPSEDLTSRSYAYEVMGLLAKAGPRSLLMEADPQLTLLRWLLTSLACESSGNSITVSVEEALSIVLSAMARMELTSAEKTMLENLLIEQIEQSATADPSSTARMRSTRYVAVRFANRCLPYSSVKARWIDVQAAGAGSTDRAEVVEEGTRGLSPYWYRMLNGSNDVAASDSGSLDFPAFGSVMGLFFPGDSVEPMKVAEAAHARHSQAFKSMITFARHILFEFAVSDAGVSPSLDSEWERRLDAAAANDEKSRKAIKKALSDPANTAASEILLCAILIAALEPNSGGREHLVELLSLAPDDLLKVVVPLVAQLPISSNNYESRATAAHAYGILASHPSADRSVVDGQTRQLVGTISGWKEAVGAAANKVHGATIGLSYYYSRAVHRGSKPGPDYDQYINLAISMLNNATDALLREASFTAIGQLSMFGVLKVAGIEKDTNVRALADKIYETAKGGDEKAIKCLGQLGMILPEPSTKETADENDLAYIESLLYKLHEIRQAEAHFSVGEALSYIALGWDSEALATKMDIDGPRPSTQPRQHMLGRIVKKVIADSSTTKPSLKKAAVMWLLCLIQFCGHRRELQETLPSCQVAFKRCLSDRDELIQETASRGLGLVYEKGDRALKDDLVRDLVGSFSSDNKTQLAGNVTEDTQLFEPGALPTGDGSVTTYKDIMSLAAEVGDSSLVYRFMSMASSNAIWSSRAAFGRFGLSNVLSDSSVDGYLANNPKLYPKLFRYRFDPNSGVQRSMNDIWNALVKDSSSTIDKYFDAIMEDLLVNILGKEWRVRQASCAAIADLVQGRQLEKYEKYLEQIWTQCFKVLDDIKESVRAAAASLARVMTGVLTRALEADTSSSKNAVAMLRHVLPFLLSPSGLESSAQEVQAFALHTLLEIIKKSNGKTLRPSLPELVERLLGLLSSLEPEAVNYIHLNASKYKLTEQKIDDMRLSSVRSSPLMEAIERCLDLLDEESMKQLRPRLEAAMKTAVGLPTKAGCSRVLVSLSTRHSALFRPYADDFLRLIEKQVLDRNDTVCSSYAMAAGYVSRGASDRQILQLVNFSMKLYFESEGDRESTLPRRSIVSGEILHALSKHASDRLAALAADILPFVFVAKHDSHEVVKEQFQDTWNEAVGGSRAVLLYLKEIVDIAASQLDSPQWVLKHSAARSVSEAATAVASTESSMSVANATLLWPALVKALSGKTWVGKEVALVGLEKFAESGQAFFDANPEAAAALVKIAAREAKRQNAEYRQHSIRSLGCVVATRSDVDLSDMVYEIGRSVIEECIAGDKMDVDIGSGQDATKKDQIKDTTLANAVETLCVSINPKVVKGPDLQPKVQRVLDAINIKPNRSSGIETAIFDGIARLFGTLRQEGVSDFLVPRIWAGIAALLFGPDPGSEALRLRRAEAILAVYDIAGEGQTARILEEVSALRKAEKSASVRKLLDRAALH